MKRAALLLTSFVLLLLPAGCADKISTSPNAGSQGGKPAAASSALPATQTVKVDYAESDFVESDRNRDPFRTYARLFAPDSSKRVTKNQRQVVVDRYSVEELRLVALVGSPDYPRAMVIDPSGRGWVLKRGDFLGRPEVVHVGGTNGTDYQLNWRVDRIRDGDLVLSREDPAQPGVPPATRVMTLHPESEKLN